MMEIRDACPDPDRPSFRRVAGALFAFTSETPDLVIRSAVSVMFVLNVDEIVFAACCPGAKPRNPGDCACRVV